MLEFSGEPVIKQGWLRAIVFFTVYVLLAGGLFWLLPQLLSTSQLAQQSADPSAESQHVILLSVFIVAAFVLTLIWLFRKYIDKQSLFSLGFAWNSEYSVVGALAAIAMLGIGTLILIVTGHLSFTSVNGSLTYLGRNLLLMVLVAIKEETVFRGYLLNNLMQSMDKWMALLVSTLLFMFVHTGNEGAALLPMIEIFIAGIMLGINYIFTQNLWFGMALHFTWNFLQGPVLGYEVSGNELPSLLQQEISGPAWLTGGAFGFEGSILAMLLNGVLIAVLTGYYSYRQTPENET